MVCRERDAILNVVEPIYFKIIGYANIEHALISHMITTKMNANHFFCFR